MRGFIPSLLYVAVLHHQLVARVWWCIERSGHTPRVAAAAGSVHGGRLPRAAAGRLGAAQRAELRGLESRRLAPPRCGLSGAMCQSVVCEEHPVALTTDHRPDVDGGARRVGVEYEAADP